MSEYTATDFDLADIAVHRHISYAVTRDVETGEWELGWTSKQLAECELYVPVQLDDLDSLNRNPYSPEALREAWEDGEKPGPGEVATEGMVTISSPDCIPYVHDGGESLMSNERVIYRPPAPDPDVVTLKEILGRWPAGLDLDGLAEFLHQHGVRAVTDDE